MEHGADGGDNVTDDNGRVGLSLLLMPSEEEEGQMGVVRIPLPVGGTTIVVGDCPTEHLRPRNVDNISLTFRMASVNDALAHSLWDVGRSHIFAGADKHQIGTLTGYAHNFVLHGLGVKLRRIELFVVEICKIDVLSCNKVGHTKLLDKRLVDGLEECFAIPSCRGNVILLHVVGVVGGSMVGGEEKQVVVTADLSV